MSDRYHTAGYSLEAPAAGLVAITPNDDGDIDARIRGLNVAASGTVRVTAIDGTIGTVYVIAGIVFPIRVRRVWATGTSATGIIGLY